MKKEEVEILKNAVRDEIIKVLHQECKDNPTSECWGPIIWSYLHGIVDAIPCPKCRSEGQKLMIFIHDIVNVKLGKEIYDKRNFREVLAELDELRKNLKYDHEINIVVEHYGSERD